MSSIFKYCLLVALLYIGSSSTSPNHPPFDGPPRNGTAQPNHPPFDGPQQSPPRNGTASPQQRFSPIDVAHPFYGSPVFLNLFQSPNVHINASSSSSIHPDHSAVEWYTETLFINNGTKGEALPVQSFGFVANVCIDFDNIVNGTIIANSLQIDCGSSKLTSVLILLGM